MPLSAGTLRKNCSMASRPPAEAPMPMTGKISAVLDVLMFFFYQPDWQR
tara:strand:+ start:5411 stop:5557 length:147 start_codon:yes stop_codon:yes gene_type:complete